MQAILWLEKFFAGCVLRTIAPEKVLRIWRTAAPGCPGTGWKACATKNLGEKYLIGGNLA
jgi:hypothetical protein